MVADLPAVHVVVFVFVPIRVIRGQFFIRQNV